MIIVMLLKSWIYVLLVLTCSVGLPSFHRVACADLPPDKGPEEIANSTATKSGDDFQEKLLDFSFEVATAIPTEPFIKDRSRAQEAVVLACLELDQLELAKRYIDEIDDWRRGSCYADLAFHLARKEEEDEARECLELAERIAETAEDWRRDRIRTKIAGTQAWLGEMREAARNEEGVADAETGKVAKVKAMLSDEGSFDRQVKSLEPTLKSGNFDLTKNALEVCVELYARFYEDIDKRERAETLIKESWNPMPIFIRIDLLSNMVNAAIEHSDKEKALGLVNETQAILDSFQWNPEHGIPIKSRVIELRFLAGDEATARMQADQLLASFDERKHEIVNIYRAEALHPLAKAYQSMGETETALAVYRRAIEEGIDNPNSRPRAEDLSATSYEMAMRGVEPDKELWERMEEIRRELSAPW